MNQHFTIIMTGRNSYPFIDKSIESALNQDYDNYEIILMDAESDDGSWDRALYYETRNSAKMSAIRNPNRQYQANNILDAVKLSLPESICVTLDTDDWFNDEQVLTKLNEIYDNQTWMTYGGSYIESPFRDVRGMYEAYPDEIIDKNAYRSHRWLGSHIRSFRRELFLKINEIDLKDYVTGDFYSMAPDLSFMWPMLEMSGEHAKYIGLPLYIYNRQNENSEANVSQSEIDRIESQIRTRPKYLRLSKL